MPRWIPVCKLEEIDDEDLVVEEIEGHEYAVYRIGDDVFATDGKCTHESFSLEGGLVMDGVIECPLHGGRFEVATGKALSPPACENLKTYPAKVENGEVLVEID